MTTRWTDNHCHLPGDLALARTLVDQARAVGVERLVDVGTDLASSTAASARARALDGVWATAGVHPHDATEGLDGLVDLLGRPEVVAVGECGLDYHYDHSPRDVQRDAFAAQIALAHQHELPLVIHTREAWDDTFAILDREGVPARTVMHCFTGGPDEARASLERGALLSFSGIVTFRSAGSLRAAAEQCPLDRLMVETDAPYLAPEPHRGRPNRPELVVRVGAGVAEAKGVPVDEVAAASWANAEAFYGLGS
ncbi:MAG: TatD family hydrolase [Microthrixaceae bacterium]|nr:TatD family hydrolase [Microthrixaceae bacterium]